MKQFWLLKRLLILRRKELISNETKWKKVFLLFVGLRKKQVPFGVFYSVVLLLPILLSGFALYKKLCDNLPWKITPIAAIETLGSFRTFLFSLKPKPGLIKYIQHGLDIANIIFFLCEIEDCNILRCGSINLGRISLFVFNSPKC